MTRANAGRIRCAIYTRKSSEEGLEQSFNSLHAQREACEAYVLSQTHEGWTALAQAYDDGGFSGGSMERPGLRRLLDDVTSGLIDVVVVYKVDRLTRSLADFAKIVEAFDAKGVSFVSVTQAFNTTTSMGRLTLNVLLSFAQFEREVTGERIRDKIAASKKKGMWMGGNLPLGYDRSEDGLSINEDEATLVRHIFARYLALGSVDALASELARDGVTSKRRTNRKGVAIGGVTLTRGALYHLLQNPVYLGRIRHKDVTYEGRHAAILDQPTFEAAQALLAQQRTLRRERPVRAAAAKLTGRIFTSDGTLMNPSFAYGRKGRPYAYYVAKTDADASQPARRLPALALEAFVLEALRRLAGRPDAAWQDLQVGLKRIEVSAERTDLIIEPAVWGLGPRTIQSRLEENEEAIANGEALRITRPMRLAFRGGRTWLLDEAGRPTSGAQAQSRALKAALAEAHRILRREGLDPSAKTVDRQAKAPDSPYERKLCTLALLAPDLQQAILTGQARGALTLKQVLEGGPPPLLWEEQRRWFAQLAAI